LKLAANKYHWRGISKGLALGYRRGRSSATWTVRRVVGLDQYEARAIGQADDSRDVNGDDVLDYYQA
jgi:hypothetical protein